MSKVDENAGLAGVSTDNALGLAEYGCAKGDGSDENPPRLAGGRERPLC